MITSFVIWWHHVAWSHVQTVRRVSVPLWDPSARGVLTTCECGKRWAQ